MNHDQPSLPRQQAPCATFTRLAPLLGSGELNPQQEAWARDHLATCASCRRQFAGYEVVTAALRRHYGGRRSLVSLPSAEDMMRIADTDVTYETQPMTPRGPRSPRNRWRLPLATALTAAMVLAVIGTLFALRGHSQPTTTGSSKTPHATQATSGKTTSGKVVEIPLSGKLTSPTAIVTGQDGAVWFLDPQTNTIGRMSSDGKVTEFPVPTANSGLVGIAVASDGSVWFTESKANQIGRISLSGAITEFKNAATVGPPSAIVAGANGVMWYTTLSPKPGWANGLVPIHADGTFGTILLLVGNIPGNPDPGLVDITRAPDGALWLVEANDNRIDRVDPALVTPTDGKRSVKQYALPAHGASDPVSIAAAPDGSVWFVNYTPGMLWHISASGVATPLPMPMPNSGFADIAVAADGTVWFSSNDNSIRSLSPSGASTKVAIPTAAAGLDGLAVGADGRVWFTETASGKIGYVTP